ncbi:MAG: hypothetical protein OXI76_14745, partial [Gemmatimonadota bacterium]|nr:hypothetical protein [Gemmatimonadota bacterium]
MTANALPKAFIGRQEGGVNLASVQEKVQKGALFIGQRQNDRQQPLAALDQHRTVLRRFGSSLQGSVTQYRKKLVRQFRRNYIRFCKLRYVNKLR